MTLNLIRLPSGTVIDGWHVVKELGNGGFAVVYLVEKNGKPHALKLARHRDASGDEKKTHARVVQELAILLTLSHPNIVSPRGFGYAETGNVFLVLDYVDGWTLGEWKERKHPTAHEILSVFVKLASALAYMHSKGILHRDLKLENVLIRKSDGEPVIIDYSCATHGHADELTDEGLPPGTDRFRAPEQFRFLRAHLDEHRARYAFQVADEIFALGAMLYELLTDARPTQHRDRFTLNHPIAAPLAARVVNPRVPAALSDLVESMLSRDPTRRPVDTEVLRRELAELLEDPGADYTAPVHPPSEQRQPEPAEGGAPAALAPKGKPRSLRLGQLAAGAAVVVLAAVVALWNVPQEAPTPPAEPHVAARAVPPNVPSAPLKTVSPDMSAPAPMFPGDAGTAPAAVQEDVSVKTQRPEAPKQARAGRAQTAPTLPDVCKGLPLVAALAMGCPGVQVRPEPFTCPAGAQEAMRDELHWRVDGERFQLVIDDRKGREEDPWFPAGADVVGVVPKGVTDPRHLQVAPPGTRFLGGKVYLIPEKTRDGDPGRVVVKYDRVKVPGKDELPVCFVVDLPAEAVKDTAAKSRNWGTGKPVSEWP
ncbi:protein kinase [Pyxidicoccus fallax]|uniref:non-specific serine/threonine protein kinase n=1 Tax=Pyxidicoccus fallax TaxID=394095 RepID=A0A848LAN9_9BACT|nr:serine/threonine-protein kinase [Pyxidicoccus fallax]NMO13915.1 protein kinase [Pyxidicoccus fallax]NPC78273.1 protein kinase [Pyxidicoccus fallax]